MALTTALRTPAHRTRTLGAAARRALHHLTTPFDPDVYLATLDPRWGTRLRGVIERIDPVTADAAAITIRPGRAWTGHLPGQHVTLGVDVDGVRHHRCFSVTSVPGPAGTRGTIEVTVQSTGHGTVSPHLVHRARPGEVVQLSQAQGDFTVPDDAASLLFLTGGSGITPALGILRAMDACGDDRDVVVLHHAPDPSRCLHPEELERLDAAPHRRILVTHTQVPQGSGGRLDAERLEERCPDWRSRETFVCGPEPLLDFATSRWEVEGLRDHLHLERFVPAARSTPGGEHTGTTIARFAASDRDVLADPATPLLDLAEDAGLDPPSGCRMGICHTCTTRLEHGCVQDLRDGRLHSAGEHVQLCVSAAVGDVVLDR